MIAEEIRVALSAVADGMFTATRPGEDNKNPSPPPVAMVTIFIEREKRTERLAFSGRITELLERLDVNPETIVVVKNGDVVAESERCEGEDELQLLSVISGG